MSESLVLFEVKDHVATITLNSPETYNTLVLEVQHALRDAVQTINDDPSIFAAVITGAGRAFSAGGDLKLMKQRLDEGFTFQDKMDGYRAQAGTTTVILSQLKVPIIAAINGGAVGAGLSIAMLCDYRIASKKAKFGVPFAQRGLIPDFGASYNLVRLAGLSRAIELSSTGRIFPAEEALRYGLVDEVVEPEALFDRVNELLDQMRMSSPYSLRKAKEAMYKAAHRLEDIQYATENEAMAMAYCYMSPEHREGVESFLEKRPTDFSKIYQK